MTYGNDSHTKTTTRHRGRQPPDSFGLSRTVEAPLMNVFPPCQCVATSAPFGLIHQKTAI